MKFYAISDISCSLSLHKEFWWSSMPYLIFLVLYLFIKNFDEVLCRIWYFLFSISSWKILMKFYAVSDSFWFLSLHEEFWWNSIPYLIFLVFYLFMKNFDEVLCRIWYFLFSISSWRILMKFSAVSDISFFLSLHEEFSWSSMP